ncbi:ATPase mitochondrial [Brachionus plicatilis]|uniref:ATPase mitochondrial n=1 Tax=Brachionus plicatilis TaxID=10195 RepID=A0A3M7R717_BRAPC|nr:ATPase mitochondrial [Brachionus plicatilis]
MSLCKINSLRLVALRSFSIRGPLAGHGDIGSGAGRGGGTGGSIREAGGKFGEREAAFENAYFKKLEAEQLESLRKRHDEEIKHHEMEIQRHLDAIKRHREHQDEIHKVNKKREKNDD